MSSDTVEKRSAEVGSVASAIEIMRCVAAAKDPIGVSELARRVGLHKSSVSRIVTTLQRANLLRRDDATGRYSIGLGFLALSAPLLADLSLTDVIRPAIGKLAQESGETGSFNIWDGDCAVSIVQVAGSNAVQAFSAPGYRNPAHATATGKMLLSRQPAAIIQKYCKAPMERFTEATVTDPALLLRELEKVRERGYAVNVGEYEKDVGAVAAAVLDSRGAVLGSVALTVPSYRLSVERSHELGRMLMECSVEIGRNLDLFYKIR